MTISNSDRTDGPFVGDGVSKVFAFDFKAFTAGDMLVVLLNTYTGVEAELTLNTDYTVSLNPDQNHYPGGTVNLVVPLAIGYTLTITTELDYLQPTDLTNQGGFYPNVITDSLDRLTILTQQLRDCIGRAVLVSFSSDYKNMVMPDPIAKYYIRWREDLKGFENVGFIDTSIIPVSPYMATVIEQQTLVAALTALGLDVDLATFSLPENTVISEYISNVLGTMTLVEALAALGLDVDIATFSLPADTVITEYIRTLLIAPDAQTARDILEIPPADTPTGHILLWPLEDPPAGFLECNGGEVLRGDYPELFSAIGTTYGAGDGSATFNIPDMRGRFVRGWDHSSGNDPDAGNRTSRGDGTTGDAVGTIQADIYQSHSHSVTLALNQTHDEMFGGYGGTGPPSGSWQLWTGPAGGNETRPKNINMMCCIKYT